jgi:hypothetical protein
MQFSGSQYPESNEVTRIGMITGQGSMIRRLGGGMWWILKIDGDTYYTYSEPNIGTPYEVDPSSPPIAPPLGSKATAIVHTHGKYSKYEDRDNFSSGEGEDKDWFKKNDVDGYVATPNGSLKEYNVKSGKVETISTEIPSDSQHPKRVNNINSKGIDLRRQETKAAEKLNQYLEIFKVNNQ